MKWLGILFMAVLLASAPGYGSAQQSKDTSPATQPQGPAVKGEPAGTAKSFTPADRQAYEKKTAEELDAIQQKIAELRMKARTGAQQQKRLLIQAANNLQMQQIAAENELAALKKASETAWGSQKTKVDKAMEGLRIAFEPTAAPRK
ncbi:MAG: hypothetical protein Q7O12_09305 [Deltaproteobacteria bacterium]|nr:hypothetical protein [Deltaproteobacteria bacterium]